MFLYLAFQAVHDPFSDSGGDKVVTGIPENDLDTDVSKHIRSTYGTGVQAEYFKALNILDSAVGALHTALTTAGVLNNTYIIFASDNGGCPTGGGRNAPLRGTKGSLFEG
jgi:arylsulfatase A-like enzyme